MIFVEKSYLASYWSSGKILRILDKAFHYFRWKNFCGYFILVKSGWNLFNCLRCFFSYHLQIINVQKWIRAFHFCKYSTLSEGTDRWDTFRLFMFFFALSGDDCQAEIKINFSIFSTEECPAVVFSQKHIFSLEGGDCPPMFGGMWIGAS